ncbi:MAG: long-chain fatty acid--CoA ligase [FCB group bacterium]|nr:long-chain fatty acid--CoA ligase [FCB group bacterium]
MSDGSYLVSKIPLGEVTVNIGTMLLENRRKCGKQPAFAQREKGIFQYYSWLELTDDIFKFSLYLGETGLQAGDHIGVISGNNYQRLVVELAIMASGFVSVPIFFKYPVEMMGDLLDFSDISMLIIADDGQLESLPVENKPVLVLGSGADRDENRTNAGNTAFYDDVMTKVKPAPGALDTLEKTYRHIAPETTCLIMYTSGTTRFPKGVMLTHRNILSQQAALKVLWKPEAGMRFLCYLPWHHSFGGLFERFFALHSGGCLAVDDSMGRDTDRLFANFAEIQPHIYFSVPKVYKEIISRVITSPEAEKIFFHKDLKFVFTAAAPLSLAISDVFKRKQTPVVEGWGLTETSPCCTLTALLLDRTPGVVGYPIPGVEIQLGEDDEILIRGDNVMTGYYKLPEVTRRAIAEDGWFHTGDIGKFTAEGLKIMARKDRVFKLSNGEKVFPSVLERNMTNICKFINHAFVFGAGLDHPLALIFPNNHLLKSPDMDETQTLDCEHPQSCEALSACYVHCLHKINCSTGVKFEHIDKVIIIDRELSLERNELTPSFKLVPRNVEKNYAAYINCMIQDRQDKLPADAYVVEICSCGNGTAEKSADSPVSE